MKRLINNSPKISVLMPVYNCELYIREAIESVLNQTFNDFEFLIVDDASTDKTVSIIKSFNDSRIKLIEKFQNLGIIDSLNYGIEIARGDYIARMDGDDICLPERFEKQVVFLDNNSDVILCGTAFQLIETDKIIKHPSDHEAILIKLCFGTSFCHSSIMGRKEVFLQDKYDENFKHAEDYDLWTRLAFKGQLANIDDVLLKYRVHENQISNTQSRVQFENSFHCKLRMLNRYNPREKFGEEQMKLVLGMNKPLTLRDCEIGLDWIKFLLHKNQILNVFENDKLKKRLYKYKIDFLRSYFSKKNILQFDSFVFFFKYTSIKEFYFISRISKIVTKKVK